MKIFTLPQSLAVLSLFAVGAASAAEMGGNPLADHVRTANDRFKDVKVATAEGYGPIPCADGLEGGSMGVHYVNMDYLKDDAVNLDKPEAILYEPEADGTMKLMAVEYITYKGRARSRDICSTSSARPTATACQRSTSSTSGPGSPTMPAPSPT